MSDPYIVTIGLETHVQLSSESKLFSDCPSGDAPEPNLHVDPVSLGLPGALPVLNRAIIERAVRVGLALDCTIADVCSFDRKHYFLSIFQKATRSQDQQPICRAGVLRLDREGREFGAYQPDSH